MTGVTVSPAAKEGGHAISMAHCTCLRWKGKEKGWAESEEMLNEWSATKFGHILHGIIIVADF